MSVYTTVAPEALASWLDRHVLTPPGRLVAMEGIAEGVQNTNYFVDAERGRFVLTLFERVDAALLPFYLGLMAHLAARGIPCPAPVATRGGGFCAELNGRAAALFTRLCGRSEASPTAMHCAIIGRALAQLHLAGRDYPAPPHPRGADWIARTAERVHLFLDADDRALLDAELRFQRSPSASLPAGVIHADLFRDNVLFLDADPLAPLRVGGLLDFYFAGHGEWLFDLAIVANDWCVRGDGALDESLLAALLSSYHALRPLTDAERAAWPRQLRAAALRFWLSRLEDFHCPLPGEAVTVRDPSAYRRILQARIAGVPDAWPCASGAAAALATPERAD